MKAQPLARPVRTYGDIQRLLLSRVRDDPRPYAERGITAGQAVRVLLQRAGNPHHGLRFLHVAGSKGKGSVALLAEHLLLGLGEPTGTFTSPHLSRWNERVRVAGRPIDDAGLADALESLRHHVADLDAAGDTLSPSFFDLVTAAALVAFARRDCRTVVLETGLGGLHDATNVVTPAACCITSIELEHTDKLGHSLTAIARHKAGIIKPGAPVITGELPLEALSVIGHCVALTGARELRLGRDWHLHSAPLDDGLGRRVHYREAATRGGYETRFRLSHPARHMALNAGMAIALVRAAGFQPDPASLASCALPARAQLLGERPWIIVDGAHTAASLAALGESLDRLPGTRRRFVISATRGKPLGALAALMTGAEEVRVTRADATRSESAQRLAHELSTLLPGVTVREDPEPGTALRQARADLPPDAVLCVCGSVYLAGLALELFQAPG